jgi:aminopeptidase C
LVESVPVRITGALVLPESSVCFWSGAPVTTGVHVPEASVHKYRFFQSWKDDVGTTGKLSAVKTKTMAQAVDQRTNN